MNIRSRRCEGILVLSLEGRLDARGAIELDEYLKGHILEKDRTVVFDMRDVPYLSSAGIRTLLAAEKSMRGRNGGIHLARVQPNPLSVLEMTGFVTLLPLHASCDDAIRAARAILAADGSEGSAGSEAPVPFFKRGAEYRVTRLGSGTTTLTINGNPSESDQLLLPVAVPASACSLGWGAPGRKVGETTSPMGDLLTAENVAVWLPPGGDGIPEYLVLDRKMTSIPLISSFLISSDGPPQYLVYLRSDSGEGITLSEIFDAISGITGSIDSEYRGILALTFSAASQEVWVHAPSPADPIRADRDELAGQVRGPFPSSILAGCAVVVDPAIQPSHFRGAVADALVCRLQNYPGAVPWVKSLVFRNMPLDDRLSPAKTIEEALAQGNPVTLCHLSTRTRVHRATLCISIVSDLILHTGTHVIINGDVPGWNPDYERITQLLHHDCSEVQLSPISGGFSGSLVFRDVAYDHHGRREMPFVLKLDKWQNIRAEIDGYEGHVKRYIQNNATQIIQHERSGDYGGILYTFVGIQGPESRIFSLEEFYLAHSPDEVLEVFDILFRKVLRAWYGQPRIRDMPLYQVYAGIFMYEGVKAWAERRYGVSAKEEYISLPHAMGQSVNPLYFMESILPSHISENWSVYEGSVHGDLNMKNVLMDGEKNIWLIDFAMTGHSHILRDIAKLEAVLKFEMIPIASDVQLQLLVDLEREFLRPERMGEIPEIPPSIRDPDIMKAFRVIRKLRQYADTITLLDDDIRQYYLALLHYTLCVPSFVSVNDAMKEYAWISSSLLCTALRATGRMGPSLQPMNSTP